MEIKGLITKGKYISFNCCEGVNDLLINGISLHAWFCDIFKQDETEHFEDYENKIISPKYSMRYVILEEKPDGRKSFDNLSAEVVMNMLYCEHNSGCYSEWTCGYGGFDYVLNDDAHSIFSELASSIGKYVHIKL